MSARFAVPAIRSFGRDVCVARGHLVTACATGFGRALATASVQPCRDDFQMIWLDAVSPATQVVDDEFLRDWPLEGIADKAVNVMIAAVMPYHPVTG